MGLIVLFIKFCSKHSNKYPLWDFSANSHFVKAFPKKKNSFRIARFGKDFDLKDGLFPYFLRYGTIHFRNKQNLSQKNFELYLHTYILPYS